MKTLFYVFSFVFTFNLFAAERYSYEGERQCFLKSDSTYRYHVVSPGPYPVAKIVAKLVVKYSGHSPYGPKRYKLELEVAPDEWIVVGTTAESEAYTENINFFKIPAATINAAIKNNLFLRFRNNNLYAGGEGNCVQLGLVYNDTNVFKCPTGETNFGVLCRPSTGTFDDTIGKSGLNGMADWREFSFESAPISKTDGELSFDYALCDGGSMEFEIWTPRGWIHINQVGTTLACTFTSDKLTIPQVYLAIGTIDNKIKFRAKGSARCAAGVGCDGMNVPVSKNIRLNYKY